MTPSAMPGGPGRRALSDEDLIDRLDAAIGRETRAGGRLESVTAHHAVVVFGSGNILLHITFACLTLATCGLFVFPWIVWANTNRQHRVMLDIDPYGDITRS